MRMTWKELFLAPIIREAIMTHGDNPEALPRKVDWPRSGLQDLSYTTNSLDFTKPYVAIDDQGGVVEWRNQGVILLITEQDNGAFRFRIALSEFGIPESVLATLQGRNLSEVVDIPGADAYRITKIDTDPLMKGTASMGKTYSANLAPDIRDVITITIELMS